jgi:hypothetical protein
MNIIMRYFITGILKKKFCLIPLLVILIVLLVFVAVYVIGRLPGQGMILPFREVKVFTRNVEITNYLSGHKKWLMSLRGEKGLATMDSMKEERSSIEDIFLRRQTLSNKDGYYVIDKDMLFAYDTSGNVINQISIARFGLNPDESYFNEILALSEETIWMTVYSLENDKWKNARLFIIEWPLEISPKDAVVVKIGDRHAADYYIAIDKDDSIAFVFCDTYWPSIPLDKKLSGAYDLHKKEYIRYFPRIEEGFSHIDYEKENGILLSGYVVDPNTGETRDIVRSSRTFWGPHGEIYFIRGTGQLWRCKSDGSEQEPVFLATKFPKRIRHIPELWLSPDRSFIVFNYSAPIITGGTRLGIVFIDLQEREYLPTLKGSFYPTWKPRFLMH